MQRLFTTDGGPVVVAHRGVHDVAPENSLGAFKAAWARGVGWCECDVRGSADGVAVVFHDAALDRLTRGRGLVEQWSWERLRELALRRGTGFCSAERIVSLEQVLGARAEGCGLLVEIKAPAREGLVERVVSLCRGLPVAIQSFDGEVLREVARRDPGMETALLVSGMPEDRGVLAGPWQGVCARHDLLDGALAEAIGEGERALGVWTLKEPADYERIAGFGPRVLITDDAPGCMGWVGARRTAIREQ